MRREVVLVEGEAKTTTTTRSRSRIENRSRARTGFRVTAKTSRTWRKTSRWFWSKSKSKTCWTRKWTRCESEARCEARARTRSCFEWASSGARLVRSWRKKISARQHLLHRSRAIGCRDRDRGSWTERNYRTGVKAGAVAKTDGVRSSDPRRRQRHRRGVAIWPPAPPSRTHIVVENTHTLESLTLTLMKHGTWTWAMHLQLRQTLRGGSPKGPRLLEPGRVTRQE